MPVNFFSHHKCATRWLADYLSRVAHANGLSFLHTDFADHEAGAADIGFFANASYPTVARQGMGGWHVIRNPLAVVVSAYYSHLHSHPTQGWPQLGPQRTLLRSVSRQQGMSLTLAFVERADIADRAPGPLLALRAWDYQDDRFVTLRSEDVVARPESTLRPILASLRPHGPLALPRDEEMCFAAFSGGRQVGEIDDTSHYRSGAADAWRAELPPGVIRDVRTRFAGLLERFYPDALLD